MNRKRLIVAVLIALLSPVCIYSYLIAVAVRVATIASVEGTVNVQSAETGKWTAGEAGMKLFEGDVVKTGTRSKVVIELDDGSVTQLTSLSNMTMEKMRRGLRGKSTDLDMEVGKSWMKVKKLDQKRDKFNVSTPTAVAGVRGTYFSTEVERTTDSTFDVFDGAIQVSQRSDPSQKVMVQTNHRSQVKKGRAPTPAKQIPSDELKKGLEQGIGGAASSEDARYDLNVVVDPPTLKAGEQGVVNVQFMENNRPFNGAVVFRLTLGGTATFVQNGSNTIEVNSNEQGFASLEITTEGGGEVQINADVDFLVEE